MTTPLAERQKTLVMKFGGASVASPEHFARIAQIIIDRKKHYPRIAIVISAMGNTTNQLIALAKQVNPDPPRREFDMLVTVGERISISLLAMALSGAGCEAVSFTGSQSGIITCTQHSEARIIDVRPHRILPVLALGKVAIIAGFQGVSTVGEITTLGRGGSDTSAVALGIALKAEKVEFFKDVPGVFSEDPKINSAANMYTFLSYQDALDIVLKGAKVLHARSIELASKNKLPLHVLTFNDAVGNRQEGTIIGLKEKEAYLTESVCSYEEVC